MLKKIPERVAITGKPAAKGIRGVHRAHTIGRRGDKQRPAWVATWTEDGKRRTRKYPVDKHGERKAKQLAIEARRSAEKSQGLVRDKVAIKAKLKEAQKYLDRI